MIELKKDILYKIEVVNGINKNIGKTSVTSYYTGKIIDEDDMFIKLHTIRDEVVLLNKHKIVRMSELDKIDNSPSVVRKEYKDFDTIYNDD
jgi:hypothetical protein